MLGKRKKGEHFFSIQLKSTDQLRSVALPNDEEGNILIEGFLGAFENVSFTEDVMLEINGANGSLRMDLTEEEFKRLIAKGRSLRGNIEAEKLVHAMGPKMGVTDLSGGGNHF